MGPMSGKVTSKGQITLPAEVRKRLGVKPGDRIEFVESNTGNIEIVARRKGLADLRGMVPYEGPPLADEAIVRMVDEARSAIAKATLKSTAKARK